MPKPEIRVPFVDYPHPGLVCEEETLTQQHFAAECDFNNVMEKWRTSGLLTHENTKTPVYADTTNALDYQSSLDLIRSSQEMFDDLPARIRDRFDNDPAKLLAFVSDEKNRDEAIKLGLIEKPLVVETSEALKATNEVSTTDA